MADRSEGRMTRRFKALGLVTLTLWCPFSLAATVFWNVNASLAAALGPPVSIDGGGYFVVDPTASNANNISSWDLSFGGVTFSPQTDVAAPSVFGAVNGALAVEFMGPGHETLFLATDSASALDVPSDNGLSVYSFVDTGSNTYFLTRGEIEGTAVPIPSTVWLMLSSLSGLGFIGGVSNGRRRAPSHSMKFAPSGTAR